MTRLDHDHAERKLEEVPGWGIVSGALHREVEFRTFVEAFGFMAMVALEAEKLDHHPDWSNSYNTVTIRLSTHDAGGLSAKDIALAQAIDAMLA